MLNPKDLSATSADCELRMISGVFCNVQAPGSLKPAGIAQVSEVILCKDLKTAP